jgi:molybdenum-dependent DNA-binding transcriptional regulator ModE
MPNIPPPLEANAHQLSTKGALPPAIDWEEGLDSIKELDRSVKEVDWATPGSSGGKAQLDRFCADFLKVIEKFKSVCIEAKKKTGEGEYERMAHYL